MKYYYTFIGICLFCFSSCKKDNVETNKLLGKWGLAMYHNSVTNVGNNVLVYEEFNPNDEVGTLHFTSDRDGFSKEGDSLITKFKYQYTESTMELKFLFEDSQLRWGEVTSELNYKVIILNSKELKIKYITKFGAVHEWLYIKL